MNGDTTHSGGASRPGFKRWLAGGVVGLTLLVLLLTLVFVNLRLRERLRQQIAGRDAQVLAQIAMLQGLSGGLDPEFGAPGKGEDPQVDEVDTLLLADQLEETMGLIRGVAAARLFNSAGHMIIAVPPGLPEVGLDARTLETLRGFEPVSRFHRDVAGLSAPVAARGTTNPPVNLAGPLLEVLVPLARGGGTRFMGAAQLYMPGESLGREFSALDRQLLLQGLGVFVLAGGVVAASLSLVFGRLLRAQGDLEHRTSSLLKANAALALAARTNAVGAVTAHLLHGLKNPLSGLQQFVVSRPTPESSDEEWREAEASTRRMQSMLQEVVRVVGEEGEGTRYELSLQELRDILLARVESAARAGGVRVVAEGEPEGVVNNHQANLTALILENLLTNAIQATPPGGTVRFVQKANGEHAEFRVADEGPGLPSHLRARLFTPVPSTKPGGSGIGLAISRRLAEHLGASLELAESSAPGCAFVLRLPLHRAEAGL